MRLDFETNALTAETDSAVDEAAADLNFPNAASASLQKLQAGVKAAREGNRAEARALLLEAANREIFDKFIRRKRFSFCVEIPRFEHRRPENNLITARVFIIFL